MRRYSRSYRRELIAVAVVVLIALLRWWAGEDVIPGRSAPPGIPGANVPRGPAAHAGLTPGIYEVERVVDGDTLLLSDGHRRFRLQGVDSPETVKPDTPVEKWGPEASAYTKAFIREAGGKVRIEVDGEPLDQHGRYLGFVWHGNRMLNEELVRAGLAHATLRYDFSSRKKDILGDAVREAKRARRGIWSEPAGDRRPTRTTN